METAKLAIHKSHPLDGSVSSPDKAVTFGRALKNDFLFDEEYRNLNHGTYLNHLTLVLSQELS